jgi:hypothetical protein
MALTWNSSAVRSEPAGRSSGTTPGCGQSELRLSLSIELVGADLDAFLAMLEAGDVSSPHLLVQRALWHHARRLGVDPAGAFHPERGPHV